MHFPTHIDPLKIYFHYQWNLPKKLIFFKQKEGKKEKNAHVLKMSSLFRGPTDYFTRLLTCVLPDFSLLQAKVLGAKYLPPLFSLLTYLFLQSETKKNMRFQQQLYV